MKITILITASLLVGNVLSDCLTTTTEDDSIHECARQCRCPSKYPSCSVKLSWNGRLNERRHHSEKSLCECKTCSGDREPDDRPSNGGGNGGRPVYKCTREIIENMSEYRCSRYCVCEDGRHCKGQYRWSADGRGGSRCECEMCRVEGSARPRPVIVLEQR